MIADPPSDVGAVQFKTIWLVPPVAVRPIGAVGVKAVLLKEISPFPKAVITRTVRVTDKSFANAKTIICSASGYPVILEKMMSLTFPCAGSVNSTLDYNVVLEVIVPPEYAAPENIS